MKGQSNRSQVREKDPDRLTIGLTVPPRGPGPPPHATDRNVRGGPEPLPHDGRLPYDPGVAYAWHSFDARGAHEDRPHRGA